jgi:hypothetical protein
MGMASRCTQGLVAALAGLTAACAQPPAAPPPELPARLGSAPGDACLAEVSAFAAEQSGQKVQLAPGAFAGGATLWLESAMQRGANGMLLDGRSRKLPEVFKLVAHADRCEIVHERSGARRQLVACNCRPLPAG